MRTTRPRGPIGAGALAAVAALLLVTGCSGTSSQSGFQGVDGRITIVKPADRKAAPDVAGQDLDGKQISLADFKGKTVVVNVWGSWCGPCRAETPDFIAAAKELSAKNVQFLGIAVQEPASATKTYVDQKQIPYPSISDQSGKTLLGFRKNLPSAAIPTTYVIDAKGRLGARIVLSKTTKSTLLGVVSDVQKGS